MRTEVIQWHDINDELPPQLITTVFTVLIKFNARKAIRIGYYNKYLNLFWICGFKEQYHTTQDFTSRDNEYLTILEWAILG